jgi:phospholipid/cholesterol/gamma-HCH transport system substrate-binding protein
MFKGDRNFAVGLFVSIAIASLVVFVIWLTGRTGTEELTRYSLMFDKDVSGLSVGGPVKFMGMSIGSVVQMNLVEDDEITRDEITGEKQKRIKIRVDIDVLASTPVDNGTFASLALQGITGVAVVNLETQPGKHPPLKVLPGNDHPVIPVHIVGFSALMASAPEIMAKLNNLLTQAGEILGEENQGAIAGTLQNIENLTASLAEEKDTIAAIPDNLNQTISEIQATVLQLQDTISELRPGINSTIENLNRSGENLASLTSRIDILLRDHEDDLGQFMEEGLAEVPALMIEARKTMRDLEKLVQELQDDPSQLIYRQADNSVKIEP